MIEPGLTWKMPTMPLPWPDMAAAAEHVLSRALELCAKRMGLDGAQAAADQVRQGNITARVHCCSGIARQIAESLGSSDQNVRAVYALDDDTLLREMCSNQETQYQSKVHLFVWMQHKTTALDSLVTAWDRALVQVCKDTIGAKGQTSLLDVQVMDDAHFEEHFAGRKKGMITRLAVYWLQTMDRTVDIVYTRQEGEKQGV
jgi:hypothetical protein